MYVDTDSRIQSVTCCTSPSPVSGLPDESYYRDERHSAVLLAAYPGHIAAMFASVFGGTADSHLPTAHRIVALKTPVGRGARWDVVRRRDAERPTTFAGSPTCRPGPRFRLVGLDRLKPVPRNAGRQLIVPTRLPVRSPRSVGEAAIDDWKDWAHLAFDPTRGPRFHTGPRG